MQINKFKKITKLKGRRKSLLSVGRSTITTVTTTRRSCVSCVSCAEAAAKRTPYVSLQLQANAGKPAN